MGVTGAGANSVIVCMVRFVQFDSCAGSYVCFFFVVRLKLPIDFIPKNERLSCLTGRVPL